MGAIASLSDTELAVDPGGEAATTITIQNTGSVVDAFVIEALGPSAPWAVVDPPTVSLYPGTSESVTIRFRPPRAASTLAGAVPFAVRVRSTEDPEGSVVEEGLLNVGRFSDIAAELIPRTSRARGRRKGKHELAVDNRGNTRLNVAVTPFDGDNQLRFELPQPGLVAEPGAATFLPVGVRARTRFWRGPGRTRPFQVLLEPEGSEPVKVDAAVLQESVLPRWLAWLLLGLLALAILIAVLWLTIVRSAIRSEARDAAGPIAKQEASKAADAAAKKAAAAAIGPPLATAQAQLDILASALHTSFPPVTSTPSPDSIDKLGNPFEVSLGVNGAGTQSATKSFDGTQIFSLTDIVLENPAGDAGTLTLQRDGAVLLRTRLNNFRDLDYHFVSPLVFGPSQGLRFVVTCENAGGKACTASMFASGFVRAPAPAPGPT